MTSCGNIFLTMCAWKNRALPNTSLKCLSISSTLAILYRLQNARGKRLEDVGEMLIESNLMLEAPSFDRERAVRKHVGDYTLFMTGLFPESVAKSRQTTRPRLLHLFDSVPLSPH